MENLVLLKNLLSSPKDVVILSHRNPDGDALGSSLALFHFLHAQQHTVKIILPSEYPGYLSWMTGIENIIIYDNFPDLAKEAIEKAELFFCLDFNSLDRIDKCGDLMMKQSAPKILIDHHLFPENFPDFVLSDTSASSTSELIYDLIYLLDLSRYLVPASADALYVGIISDTGSFLYNTSSKVFRITANLLDRGVDDVGIQNRLHNNLEAKQLKILGHCLNNRLEILEEFSTALVTITKEDYLEYDIQRGDTEGIVNMLLRIESIKMAALITEQPTIVKLSLRSKGDFSVQEIATKHFKGGGHKNASGAASFIGLKPTIRKFKEILPLYGEQLSLK
jgi:phosphoesterase RecJ-like protein